MEIEFEHLGSNGPEVPEPQSPNGLGLRAVLLLGGVAAALVVLFLVARPDSGETAAGTPRTSSTTTLPPSTTTTNAPESTVAQSTTPAGPTLGTPAITVGDQYVGDDGLDRVRILAFPSEAVAVDGGWLATSGGEQPGLFFSHDGLTWTTVDSTLSEVRWARLHSDGENVFATGVERNMTRSWLRGEDGAFTLRDTVPLIGRGAGSQEIIGVGLSGIVAGNNVELRQPAEDEQMAARLSDLLGEPVDESVCSVELTNEIDFLDCDGTVVESRRFDTFTDDQINCIFTIDFQARSRARVILDLDGRESAMELTPGVFLAGLQLVNGGAVALVADLDGFCTEEDLRIQLLLLDSNGRQVLIAEVDSDLVNGPAPTLVRRDGAIHLLVGNRAFVVSSTGNEVLPDLVELPRPDGAGDGRFAIGGGPLLGFVEVADGRATGTVWLSADGLTWTDIRVDEVVNDIGLFASSEQLAILSLLGPLATELVRVPLR